MCMIASLCNIRLLMENHYSVFKILFDIKKPMIMTSTSSEGGALACGIWAGGVESNANVQKVDVRVIAFAFSACCDRGED